MLSHGLYTFSHHHTLASTFIERFGFGFICVRATVPFILVVKLPEIPGNTLDSYEFTYRHIVVLHKRMAGGGWQRMAVVLDLTVRVIISIQSIYNNANNRVNRIKISRPIKRHVEHYLYYARR